MAELCITLLHSLLLVTWRNWDYSFLCSFPLYNEETLFSNWSRCSISIFFLPFFIFISCFIILFSQHCSHKTSIWQFCNHLYIVSPLSLHQRLVFCSLLHPQGLDLCLRNTMSITDICSEVEWINTKEFVCFWWLSVIALASWEELGLCHFQCIFRGSGPGVGTSAFHPGLTWGMCLPFSFCTAPTQRTPWQQCQHAAAPKLCKAQKWCLAHPQAPIS